LENQEAHVLYGGCLEDWDRKLNWVDHTEAYKEVVKLLGYRQSYGSDAVNHWQANAIERVVNELLNPTDQTENNLDPFVDITDQIVSDVAARLKYIHMQFSGSKSLDESPPITATDITIHINDALTSCGYDVADCVRYDLRTALDTVLQPVRNANWFQ
jgi:hypothetical protein